MIIYNTGQRLLANMKVTWIENNMSVAMFEDCNSLYGPDVCMSDFDIYREGEVVGSNKSFWGSTYLVVACNDDKIREVEISKVEVK